MMSKASEFEAVMDRLRDAQDEESAMEAAKAALLHLAQNRDRIARALRRDEYIESPPILLAPESKAQIAALREAVR